MPLIDQTDISVVIHDVQHQLGRVHALEQQLLLVVLCRDRLFGFVVLRIRLVAFVQRQKLYEHLHRLSDLLRYKEDDIGLILRGDLVIIRKSLFGLEL